MSSNRVVVFSKSADPGTVKTRLRELLTEDQCLSLHIALLKDTIQRVKLFEPVLYLSGSGHLSFETDLLVRNQNGRDLGERLADAFRKELRKFVKVIVIGTDSPTFPVEQISKAFTALDRHDAVFGPSEDGGYYLIGLRTFVPQIFEDIPWGSSTVLKETLAKIGGHSYSLLETYFDIDTPQDLIRLEKELSKAGTLPNLRKWMQGYRRNRS